MNAVYTAEFILDCRMAKWGLDGIGKGVDTLGNPGYWPVAYDLTGRSMTCSWAVALWEGEAEWVCSCVIFVLVSFSDTWLPILSSNLLNQQLGLHPWQFHEMSRSENFISQRTLHPYLSLQTHGHCFNPPLPWSDNHLLNCPSASTFPFWSYQNTIFF